MDSGLRDTDVTWGGTMAPRPSPSWLKYELIWRARLAARVTRVNLESTRSRSSSTGGSIMVGRRSAMNCQLLGSAVALEYTGDRPCGPVYLVVDDHRIGDGPTDPLLLQADGEALCDVGLVVAAGPQTGLLRLP